MVFGLKIAKYKKKSYAKFNLHKIRKKLITNSSTYGLSTHFFVDL
jgi:hypothetical protein